MIRDWFIEAKSHEGVRVFTDNDCEFIIYKGFKIYCNSEIYTIKDARLSDFYTEVKEGDHQQLVELGFIEGADAISFKRSEDRVKYFNKKLENLYNQRKYYEKNLKKDKRLFTKKINTCNQKIEEAVDKLIFYKSKIQ